MKNTSSFFPLLLMVIVSCLLFLNYGCGQVTPTPVNVNHWSWLNPLPQGNPIEGIHGTSNSNIFAVGDGGAVAHFNGTTWTRIETATSEFFCRVWTPSTNIAFVVSASDHIWKYDGNSWSIVYRDTDSTQHMKSIFGFSSSDIFVGAIGEMLHYDGTSWSTMEIDTDNYINGIWGSDRNHVHAVTLDGKIFFFNGTSWAKEAEFSDPMTTFQAVWGTATNDVYAVATEGLNIVYHFDGDSWQPVDLGISSLPPLWSVWGSTPNDIYIVGDSGNVTHFDGTDWTPQAVPLTLDFKCVWGSSSSNVLVGGPYGALLRYNGSDWDLDSSDYVMFFGGVWGTGPNNVYIGGGTGADGQAALFRYDGTHLIPLESGTNYQIERLWGTSDHDIFAATSYGDFGGSIRHYDGTTWSDSFLAGFPFTNVWGSSSTDVFALGDNNTNSFIMHYDGTTWVTQEVLDYDLGCLMGTASNDVYIGGNFGSYTSGKILHYDGSSWEVIETGIADSYISLFALPNGHLYAGTLYSRLVRYDGTTWTEVANVDPADIYAIWGASDNDLFLASPDGIRHYNGSTVSALMPPYTDSDTNFPIRLWGSGANDVFAVGNGGTILHYGQ